ncbi:MAG: hypothetical protein HS113_25745 [Verrucomicrobiales bacterium]|nr:hypothetical protein [Verrucomicrobiales bacterium]
MLIELWLGPELTRRAYGDATDDTDRKVDVYVVWRDVLGVLKVQADALDRAYLRDWAARLNLTDLLRRALDDAGLPLGS